MTTFATTSTNQPIELQERLYPVRFDCYRIEPDSAGAGWHRGAPGVTRRWEFPDANVLLSALGDGERFGPWGWSGGSDARPNVFVASPPEEEPINVGMYRTNLRVREGTMLDCFQPGGGGYGDPFTRDVDFVVEDVMEGLVSLEGAERDYGVSLSLDSRGRATVDEAETQRIRSSRRGVGT